MVTNTSKSQFAPLKLIILTILLFTSLTSHASDISEEIKAYITSIKAIAVEFTQQDSSGQSSQGMLIINKPYKFRCNYYEPFPIVIIGNKNYVSVYDYEMENLSRIKAKENIFNFLLVDNVNFDNQFEILSAKEQSGNYVLRLKSHDLNKVSEIWFDKKTKDIRKMQIFEENNTITLIFGESLKIDNVSDSLFIMKDPDLFGKPARFNKQELEKKYRVVR